MLSPSWPGSAWLLVAVFIAMIVFLGLRARRRDRREFRRFKNYRSTVRRQEMMRKWLRDSFLTFGGLAIVLLLLVWQYVPLLLEAAWALEPVAWARERADLGLIAVIAVAAIFMITTGVLYLARGELEGGEIPAIGDIQAMVPRNRAEVRIGALLSVNAGVVEELVFRLALPALLYGAFGSVEFALITSALVFGGLHAYQGPVGIIGTTIIGLLLLALYVASGSILLPIIAHALIDLRTFVQIPLIVLRVPAAPRPRSATTGARAR